jgi:hypothetical protein
MLDSKQLALRYLANACEDMADVCDKSISTLDNKKILINLEKEFGNLLAAIKEVTEQYKLDETRIFLEVDKAIKRRSKEL